MKSAGKARSNGLYRHIRTSKEIIRNLLNDCDNSSIKLRITAKGRVTVYKSRSSMDDEEILFLHQILLNGGEH